MVVQPQQYEQTLEEHSAPWELEALGRLNSLEMPFVTNHPDPEFLVATGFGETGTFQVAEELGAIGIKAAVCNLTYPAKIDNDSLTLTPVIMEQTILKSYAAILDYLNGSTGRDENTPINMVGHSKGFGELLKFASTYPQACRQLAGAAPLGANCIPSIMGTTAKEYRESFRERLRASGLVSALISHPEAPRLLDEFKVGMHYIRTEDGPGMIRKLFALGKLKHLVIGYEDALCPPDECEQAIGLKGVVVPTYGKHDPVDTAAGMAQLILAISTIR